MHFINLWFLSFLIIANDCVIRGFSTLLRTSDNTIIEIRRVKMRSMRYRLELEAGDEGYLICNAETTWNSMP